MAFIYITDAPGVGKTTIQQSKELSGYETYDLDDLGGPYNKNSGNKAIVPPAHERSDDWFNRHEWRTDLNLINSLYLKSIYKTIIIIGVAEDDVEFINLFDKVIYLHVDETVLTHRIHYRKNGDFGKNNSELVTILNRKQKLDKRYTHKYAIIINANQLIDKVLADIKNTLQ